MGYEYSTYHFYGVHVPRRKYFTIGQNEETVWLDAIIRHTPGLNDTGLCHATAGQYDQPELFLCVVPEGESSEVELGTFVVANRGLHNNDLPEWNQLLRQLAEAAGYGDLGDPGWIVVPDLS